MAKNKHKDKKSKLKVAAKGKGAKVIALPAYSNVIGLFTRERLVR